MRLRNCHRLLSSSLQPVVEGVGVVAAVLPGAAAAVNVDAVSVAAAVNGAVAVAEVAV